MFLYCLHFSCTSLMSDSRVSSLAVLGSVVRVEQQTRGRRGRRSASCTLFCLSISWISWPDEGGERDRWRAFPDGGMERTEQRSVVWEPQPPAAADIYQVKLLQRMHRPCMEFFNSNAHTHKNYIPKISFSVLYCTAWLVYYLWYFLLSWAAFCLEVARIGEIHGLLSVNSHTLHPFHIGG